MRIAWAALLKKKEVETIGSAAAVAENDANQPPIPTRSKRSHTSFPLTLRPAKRADSETFSPTESEGMRLYCWNTNPTCRALTFARSPRLARTTSTPIR